MECGRGMVGFGASLRSGESHGDCFDLAVAEPRKSVWVSEIAKAFAAEKEK